VFELTGPRKGSDSAALFVKGGHDAALKEAMWDTISEFVLTGELKPPPGTSLSGSQSPWAVYSGAAAPVLWLVGIVALLLYPIWIVRLRIDKWYKTFAAGAYFYAIDVVLTEV
jgi:hypothetical protein